MESLNEKIRRLRKEKGISQVEIAKASGINQASYSNIEKGSTTSISIEVGKGIAKALGVSFNELFDIEVQQDDSLFEELKAENEKLKEQVGIKNRESLFDVERIERLDFELRTLKEHLITWPEHYLLGFNSKLRKDFKENLITEDGAVSMTSLVYDIVAKAFLFSTAFKIEFVDNLEKTLKKKHESIYDYDFKLFVNMVRELQGDYKDFEKEME